MTDSGSLDGPATGEGYIAHQLVVMFECVLRTETVVDAFVRLLFLLEVEEKKGP
jgi:hypothetical protein